MKIYHKLACGVFISSVFLGLLGTVSWRINNKIKKDNQHIAKNSLIEVETSKEMTRSIQAIQAASQEILVDKLNENKEEDSTRGNAEVIKAGNLIQRELLKFEKNLNPSKEANINALATEGNLRYGDSLTEAEELEIIEAVEQKFLIYKSKMDRYIVLVDSDPDKAYSFLEEEIEPLVKEELLPLVREYQDDALQELKYKTVNINQSLEEDNTFIAGFALFSLVVSVGIGWSISYQISEKIKKLTAAAERVGKGQLEPIAIDPKENESELKILALSFNQMIEGVKQSTVSRSYLDNILGSMIDSLIVIELDGTIEKVNSATLKLLGYKKEELIDRKIDVIVKDRADELESTIVSHRFIGNFETTYLTKAGKKIPVAFSSSYLIDNDKKIIGIVCVAKDITEKYLAEKALRESETRYALASRAANDGLWDWKLNNNQIYYSSRWQNLLGYDRAELTNNPQEWFSRIHPDYLTEVTELIERLKNKELFQFEISYQMRHKNGNYRWMLCRGIAVEDDEGTIYRITGSQTDITKSRQIEEQLRYAAIHDRLTGLYNRAFFDRELAKSIDLANRDRNYLFAVLFIDLDRFKIVNDSLGHQAGDRLLIDIAKKLEDTIRDRDIVARLGGDEFVILLKQIDRLENATFIADRILEKLAHPIDLKGHEVSVTASIGIALSDRNYNNIEDFLRDADTAMYEAKASGKGRYTIFEPNMYQNALKRLKLDKDLRRAIEKNQFELFYQPIVELTNHKIIGFEALLRWQHPESGLISPAEFIPIAEETGSILSIGWWVLHAACANISKWQQEYESYRGLKISVNISAVQFSQLDFVERVTEILETTGLNPQCLQLEITETTIIKNIDRAKSILKQLKATGIKISLDDFGTGYSSLSYLYKLPIDTLKIDRSFLDNVDRDSDKLEVIRTIILLAKNLGMNVIAEGIENEQQKALLLEYCCQYGQGFLFYKPLSSSLAAGALMISNSMLN